MNENVLDSEKPVTEGWLWKWTNYIKGYQQRWFVLSNGLFSYYRTQTEVTQSCRGAINLASACIVSEDSCNFVISNGKSRAVYLKARTETEKDKWISALERAKAVAANSNASDDSSDEGDLSSVKSHSRLKVRTKSFKSMHLQNIHSSPELSSKFGCMITCNDIIFRQGEALHKAVVDLRELDKSLESLSLNSDLMNKIKIVNERATLFRMTSAAMMSACSDFVESVSAKCNHTDSSQEDGISNLNAGSLVSKSKSERQVKATLKRIAGSTSSSDDEFLDAIDSDVFAVEIVPPYHVPGSSSLPIQTEDKNLPPVKQIRKYRTSIPEKPNKAINLWNIMKNCIGKDLSKIPMPVNFNEPLSFLQRLAEDIEYSSLINRAAQCTSSQEQMVYVVALSVSTYASTMYRLGKPFNPLLGETFEFDRRDDLGYRMICEQVSHHPPIAAMYVESADVGPNSGWTYWAEICVTSKFRGKYININPLGTAHLKFHASGNHYTWQKVTTTVHNIILGTIWVDQSGDAEVINHKTGDYCKHKYFPYSYFSSESPRKVSGVVMDKDHFAHYVVSGTWDSHIDCAQIESVESKSRSKPLYKTYPSERIWEKKPLPVNAEKMYHFSEFALSLNEETDGVAPTDSRMRPDQRSLEKGDLDAANNIKLALEQAQRKRIKSAKNVESDISATDQTLTEVTPKNSFCQPVWFKKKMCEITNTEAFVYEGLYWKNRRTQDWSMCPAIFDVDTDKGDDSAEKALVEKA